MTASVLAIVATGVSILWWWLRRKTTPEKANRDRYAQIDRDIASKDSQSATLHSATDLDELERLERMRNARDDRS